MPYELVIFDLDGTLVDSAPDLATALGLALGDLGLPSHDVAAVRRMIGEGQRVLVERALRQAGADPEQPGLLDQAVARFRAHYSAHLVEQTRPYPGVEETLAVLARSRPLAVATNKPGAWARQIVTALGLMPHLRWVLGEDDVGRRKPDPLLLHTLCRQAGVAPAAALFVGDSAIDVRTAEAASMDMVLCTYGYGHPPLPAASRRIDAFPQVLPLILDNSQPQPQP
jgi:phosphoglycolate phosphatase